VCQSRHKSIAQPSSAHAPAQRKNTSTQPPVSVPEAAQPPPAVAPSPSPRYSYPPLASDMLGTIVSSASSPRISMATTNNEVARKNTSPPPVVPTPSPITSAPASTSGTDNTSNELRLRAERAEKEAEDLKVRLQAAEKTILILEEKLAVAGATIPSSIVAPPPSPVMKGPPPPPPPMKKLGGKSPNAPLDLASALAGTSLRKTETIMDTPAAKDSSEPEKAKPGLNIAMLALEQRKNLKKSSPSTPVAKVEKLDPSGNYANCFLFLSCKHLSY
jgi:hypothetical protein